MGTRVRSFAKINLGLAIGPARPDGFHELATLYQTIALHDLVTVSARLSRLGSSRITLTSNHSRVPRDPRNTAWKMVDRALKEMHLHADVAIQIEKRLPIRGGLGAGSANAAAALLGLERELGTALPEQQRLALAAHVGSDVPLFLLGGAVLGTGRGEQVQAVSDFARTPCVIAVPTVGVSTPQAFRDWDSRLLRGPQPGNLTDANEPDTLSELGSVYASNLRMLGESESSGTNLLSPQGAANTLHALVSSGIQNDFEKVVFPQHSILRGIKQHLIGTGSGSPALYAALSGSGSALFGLYKFEADARAAQQRVQATGVEALLTETLPRALYWKTMFAE